MAGKQLTRRLNGSAVEQGWTVYDSIYVSLAKTANAELITADEKLANALAGRYPVRWLGSLQLGYPRRFNPLNAAVL